VSGTHAIHEAAQVIERLQSLPGGPELLAQARRREDIALVGGAVRDLLLGHWPRELDVTVASDSVALAEALAASISPSERAYGHAVEPVLHDRFNTASVAWEYGRIDIAELRAESYRAAGALPEVRPGTVEEDLARRDFTVNAISLQLDGAERGRLRAADGALEDLGAGMLRVLHDASFRDDPTRILRLARYAARLGFEIEPETLRLAREAITAGALGTVSGARIGAELWLACTEPDAIGALAALDRLGVLAALGMPAPFDGALAEQALALLPPDGSRGALMMALALRPAAAGADASARAAAERLLDPFELTADTRDRALAGAFDSFGLADLHGRESPSQLRELLAGAPVEAVAIAGAHAGRQSPESLEKARRWLGELRRVRLEIDGRDLLAAGVPQGPEIGARLARTLDLKLDGELAHGREPELRAALEAPP
jgi:tRNA nucleotidyltransferase (CCA-adding enzyme)